MKDNFSELFNIYIHILNQTSLVNNIEYSSYYLCKSLSSCNYLLNYRTKQFYANSLSTQTNELFSFDSDIKDTIVSSISILIKPL